MPNGHTHDAVTWFLVTPVALLAWNVTQDVGKSAVFTGAFVFAGLMFSGDLDLPSSQYRRWGRLRWLWKPYQWLVPHRSVISHGVLLGPLGRLLYLLGVALAVVAVINRVQSGVWSFPWREMNGAIALAAALDEHTWALAAWGLLGLTIGGASHSVVDWGWTGIRRRMRSR